MSATTTKVQLADTLKMMMRTTPLDKITIDELTTKAGVTRNTFYYHFEDIYALLKWIYDQEIVSQMRAHAQIDEWHQAYQLLLDYIYDNREFCIASVHSVGRDLLERLLITVSSEMVQRVVTDADQELPRVLADDIVNFYAIALVGQIIKWLIDGVVEPKSALMRRADIVLSGGIKNAISNGRKSYGYFELNKNEH
ncbi:TetR/AcrR family transcriptional regulator C-terminal domain-containing protein [Lacticaseibacillus zhaodongensis]|uniref:TetR/AcrR family transcriptional regulator C-terminal domain-containing protein n=1 Tax=Lacticaseibacillus zhaodongensis TaxID=2668065 RepID=UPI0012D3269F|nr:TetR/AcrR family transcriptional regulator C-terminal domain-containing protein [Lacticaseibacillus zhaodongensis]